MVAILKRELSSYFNSAVAYVVMAVYFRKHRKGLKYRFQYKSY